MNFDLVTDRKPIHIGIDIDGTLNAFPEFFTTLGKVWRSSGTGSVYLITGLGKDGAHRKLKEITTEFGNDFFDECIDTSVYNDVERMMIGRVSHNEIIVGHFKQRICREKGISIIFDDMAKIHRLCGNIPVFEVA